MYTNVIAKYSILIALTIISSGTGQPQVKSGTIQEDPCKVKNRVVADVDYCDRYWECVDGQPELYDCPNGLVFAGKHRGVTEGCDYPWRANYCDNKQLANGPISREHCDWLYGIFGHEASCTRYWTCWNGTATEQLCIGGLLYNENARSCDWPENVEGCQKHPLCNEEPNGNVPLGKSCNRYWQCQGGYPRLQRCPAMLVFDKRSLRCVIPPTEDCDIPTTPQPSPEELQEQGEEQSEQNTPPTLPARPNVPRGAAQVQQAQPSQQRPQSQPLQQRPTTESAQLQQRPTGQLAQQQQQRPAIQPTAQLQQRPTVEPAQSQQKPQIPQYQQQQSQPQQPFVQQPQQPYVQQQQQQYSQQQPFSQQQQQFSQQQQPFLQQQQQQQQKPFSQQQQQRQPNVQQKPQPQQFQLPPQQQQSTLQQQQFDSPLPIPLRNRPLK